jgi:methionine synthase II (cobalamin-independent)
LSVHPWPRGTVTGIGSLPGTDPAEAARLVFGELTELPHLPELPNRGAGADMIGRTAALLVELPVELVPSGWRFAAHPGRDLRRARDYLAWDLDALEAAATGHTGAVKVQVAGPWTLAASVELANGHRAVSDRGAVRDVVASLAEGIGRHLAEVARRVPGAQLVLQLDEPSLPAVLAGQVPTPSGYGTVRSVDVTLGEQVLREVLDVAPVGGRVVHCCAGAVPFDVLRNAGVDAISLDASTLTAGSYDALGEAVEAGVALWLGVLPSTDAPVSFDDARARLRALWTALGFPPAQLADDAVPTPACGLAGASPEHVRAVLRVLRELAKWLPEADEDRPGS